MWVFSLDVNLVFCLLVMRVILASPSLCVAAGAPSSESVGLISGSPAYPWASPLFASFVCVNLPKKNKILAHTLVKMKFSCELFFARGRLLTFQELFDFGLVISLCFIAIPVASQLHDFYTLYGPLLLVCCRWLGESLLKNWSDGLHLISWRRHFCLLQLILGATVSCVLV